MSAATFPLTVFKEKRRLLANRLGLHTNKNFGDGAVMDGSVTLDASGISRPPVGPARVAGSRLATSPTGTFALSAAAEAEGLRTASFGLTMNLGSQAAASYAVSPGNQVRLRAQASAISLGFFRYSYIVPVGGRLDVVSTGTSVPEPSTLVMLASGAVALVGLTLGRRRAPLSPANFRGTPKPN